ncbi:hypothetical protein [Bifidobacterium merycicum]|mgnify:CR=1 FL=1|uniref:hypothetical protein n=1 Tax=Bifidobacterium merycicum TaxID=78345 RepID=UPI00156A1A11|nr:hypothetical protein [Bifidobacterium merycicum]MEE1296356.1 hypothetical protein [Bifidobacterium sp.]
MNDYDDLDRELRYLNNVNNLDAKYMQLRFYELPDYDPDLAQDFTNCHYRLATASSTDDIEIPQAYVVPPTMLAAMATGSPFAAPADDERLEDSVHLLDAYELGLSDVGLGLGYDEESSDRELRREFAGECADAYEAVSGLFDHGRILRGDCTFGMLPLLVTAGPRTEADGRLHGAVLSISLPLFPDGDDGSRRMLIHSDERRFPDLAHYRAFAYYLQAMYRKATGGTVASAYRLLVGHQGLSARI